MVQEPTQKNAIVFVDGQNLFYASKAAFGYQYPNYDIKILAETICKQQDWQLKEVRFYTGIPAEEDNSFWHTFWNNKLIYMGQTGVKIVSRPLRYRNMRVRHKQFLLDRKKE